MAVDASLALAARRRGPQRLRSGRLTTAGADFGGRAPRSSAARAVHARGGTFVVAETRLAPWRALTRRGRIASLCRHPGRRWTWTRWRLAPSLLVRPSPRRPLQPSKQLNAPPATRALRQPGRRRTLRHGRRALLRGFEPRASDHLSLEGAALGSTSRASLLAASKALCSYTCAARVVQTRLHWRQRRRKVPGVLRVHA